jgi:Zn finger protein HypA/HybF involved in hydrogenase expression
MEKVRGMFECNSCGATGSAEFKYLCEEGCPICGSLNVNIYGGEDVELD